MSGCKFIFKISGILLPVLLWNCDSIPRDNVFDPKNPDSIAPQKVMIEAFVNTANPETVNEIAIQALDSLAERYNGRIVIAEYHRNTQDYTDPYHLEKNELLYRKYISQFDNVKGVPDIFINGRRHRVQGASTPAFSIFRLESALTDEISANTAFSIEIAIDNQGSLIVPVVQVARLGRNAAGNLLLKAVMIRDYGAPALKRVVSGMVESRLIRSLAPGEIQEIRMPELPFETDASGTLIVYVSDSETFEIYQCESRSIR